MLTNLHVKNLALIEEADVSFTRGLNILSGETGAGKSILIGSINTALGAKAARVLFFSGLKNDFPKIGAPHDVFHLQFFAKRFNGCVIFSNAVKLIVERNRDQRKRLRVKVPQFGERIQERQRILAARNPDRDFIAGFNHIVFVHRRARQA